MNCPQTVFK